MFVCFGWNSRIAHIFAFDLIVSAHYSRLGKRAHHKTIAVRTNCKEEFARLPVLDHCASAPPRPMDGRGINRLHNLDFHQNYERERVRTPPKRSAQLIAVRADCVLLSVHACVRVRKSVLAGRHFTTSPRRASFLISPCKKKKKTREVHISDVASEFIMSVLWYDVRGMAECSKIHIHAAHVLSADTFQHSTPSRKLSH